MISIKEIPLKFPDMPLYIRPVSLSCLFLVAATAHAQLPDLPGENPALFGAIEQQKAFTLFSMFRHQEELALDSINDGCYARCHLMSLRLKQMGIEVRRAWAFSAPRTQLHAKTTRSSSGFVEWDWHVAPLVPVTIGEKLHWLVFDPCLCTRPVSLDAWRDRLRKDSVSPLPSLAVTQLGEPPIRNGIRVPGSGYWLQPDPKEGPNVHAVKTLGSMKRPPKK